MNLIHTKMPGPEDLNQTLQIKIRCAIICQQRVAGNAWQAEKTSAGALMGREILPSATYCNWKNRMANGASAILSSSPYMFHAVRPANAARAGPATRSGQYDDILCAPLFAIWHKSEVAVSSAYSQMATLLRADKYVSGSPCRVTSSSPWMMERWQRLVVITAGIHPAG